MLARARSRSASLVFPIEDPSGPGPRSVDGPKHGGSSKTSRRVVHEPQDPDELAKRWLLLDQRIKPSFRLCSWERATQDDLLRRPGKWRRTSSAMLLGVICLIKRYAFGPSS